jgi:hypothetical protein
MGAIAVLCEARSPAPDAADAHAGAAAVTAELYAYGALCARAFASSGDTRSVGAGALCDHLGGNRLAALLFRCAGDAARGLDAAHAIDRLVRGAAPDAFDPAEAAVLAHAYEGFLAAYDPIRRRARGVYFTPPTVAAYVVCRVDRMLREEVGLASGIAASVDATGAPVHVLDPACGTGAFLAQVVRLAHRALAAGHAPVPDGSGEVASWPAHARAVLLPRLHGIEVMPASYAVCHAHLALALAATGCPLRATDVLDVWLGDALDDALAPARVPAGDRHAELAAALAGERERARALADTGGAAVIVMNPPYRRGARAPGAASRGSVATERAYREGLAGERNLQPLADDYVRFVRLAQRAMDARTWGVVGMVANSTFLSGRLHRRMRESLGETFVAVDVVDLHGSARKHRAPAGQKRDENVFDVGQGVAVVVLRRDVQGRGPPRVRYAQLRGSRADKEDALARDLVPEAQPLRSPPPTRPWVPVAEVPPEYARFVPLDALFSFHSVGGKPGDDAVLVGFDTDAVLRQLEAARRSDRPGATESARKLAVRSAAQPLDRARVVPYAYRPFDTRFVYDDTELWTRPVPALRARIDGQPLLLTSRVMNDPAFAHVFATRTLPDVIFLSPTSSVNCHVFPSSALRVEPVVQALGRVADPRAAFAYVYAMLHSPTYRSRYLPGLAFDFPRIPVTGSAVLFDALAAIGSELLALHLLDDVTLDANELPRFHDGGDRRVTHAGTGDRGAPDVVDGSGKLHVNPTSYFAPVSPATWRHRVGGYQVLRKWLLDRKRAGQSLRDGDIEHYRGAIARVGRSIALAVRVDARIADHGGWPDAFVSDPGDRDRQT